MAYGDVYFKMQANGSTATSAATAHLVFGTYAGLSLLNNEDVVNIQLWATGADSRLWDNTVTNNTGLRLTTAASLYDLPPMRVGDASRIHFAREAAANVTMGWTIWRRVLGPNQ